MINGGQGAPIVPIYHKFLLKNLPFKNTIMFLNIGGVANLTYYDQKLLLGFDTGPGNGLMDTYMQINCNKSFDNNGHYASLGKPNMEIIQKMLAIDFFTKKYPNPSIN